MRPIAIDYRTQYEAAEIRIRELEAQVKANYTVSEKRGQSIAKAREILQDTDWSGLEADLRKTIKQVWEALEGK